MKACDRLEHMSAFFLLFAGFATLCTRQRIIEPHEKARPDNVARGANVCSRVGRASYKELWTKFRPRQAWGRAHTRTIVDWITRIAAHELQEGRPPLNEIVTPANKFYPTEAWDIRGSGIKPYLKYLSGLSIPYLSHQEAQEACWRYWSNHAPKVRKAKQAAQTDADDFGWEKRYVEDRESVFTKRNAAAIRAAKKRDKYTCQACGFKLTANGKNIIDCHHTIPMSHFNGRRRAKLSDLVCLCPTCHRIAHSKPYPLNVPAIQKARNQIVR